jgi:hypothetical protein
MMHGHEKSDSAIVAVKPTNKAERSAAETVEPRAGTKGNAGQPNTCRTQRRESVSQELERTFTAPRHHSSAPLFQEKPRLIRPGGAIRVNKSPPSQCASGSGRSWK